MSRNEKLGCLFLVVALLVVPVSVFLAIVLDINTREIHEDEYATISEWSLDDTELRDAVREAMKDGNITFREYDRLVLVHDMKPVRDHKGALRARLAQEK